MKTDMAWKAGLAFWLVVGGVGCGREDAQAYVPEPGARQDIPTSSVPAPADGTATSPAPAPSPSPAPPALPAEAPVDASWWQVNPEPSAMTFEVPACLPVRAMTGKRFTHPCTVKGFGPQGSLVHFQRLDDAGRTLEEAAYLDGTQTRLWRTLHTYDAQGREVERVRFPSAGPESNTTGWIYDEAGRLLLLYTDYERTYHAYNERGDLVFAEQVSKQHMGSRWEKHLYGATGRLETIWYADHDYCYAGSTSSDPSCGAVGRKQYTYHSNGQMKGESFSAYQLSYNYEWHKTFDERGRLVVHDQVANESSFHITRAYDARDLPVEELHSSGGSSGTSEHKSRWLYDDAGQLGAEHLVWAWDMPWAQYPSSGRTVTLNRFFHACGSGELLFAEQDANEDGARDGWRELLRDAAGNLRLERYHGSFIQSAARSRVEYDYSCRE